MSARSTVKFRINPKLPRPLTPVQRKRLTAVAANPDSEIDCSDIPCQAPPVQWSRPDALTPSENKQQITLRLDSDILSFFKNTGKRYQSRINAALREYVKAHREPV